jgi:hypothetical protein
MLVSIKSKILKIKHEFVTSVMHYIIIVNFNAVWTWKYGWKKIKNEPPFPKGTLNQFLSLHRPSSPYNSSPFQPTKRTPHNRTPKKLLRPWAVSPRTDSAAKTPRIARSRTRPQFAVDPLGGRLARDQ